MIRFHTEWLDRKILNLLMPNFNSWEFYVKNLIH